MPFSIISVNAVKFDRTDDIIVVGMGGAGISAGLEAHAAGSSVTILERASGGGGSTALAGGYLYLGAGTSVQYANQQADTVKAMYDYLLASTPCPDHAKLHAYCEESVSHFEWLEAHGVPFNRRFYDQKHFEHPTQESLAWTGNEKVWPFPQIAAPFARGHRADAPAGSGGAALMTALTASAERSSGIHLCYNERAIGLVQDKDGHICGVETVQFGVRRAYGARKGVILATGGFGMNQALIERYCPALALTGIEIIGTPNSDGAGLEMGLLAGADIQFPQSMFVTSPIYPPGSLLEGILVNSEGRRFVAEDSYHGRTTAAMLRQPGQKVWLICDVESFDRPVMGQELVDAWDDLGKMERDLSLPEGRLLSTISDYNQHAAMGADPMFHKAKDYLRPIDKAPYAAIDCSLNSAPYLGFTLGGLRTGVDGHVLRPDGSVIDGLFAAGAVAANIAAAQGLENYASGTCIGESTFFGRRCGRSAAALPARHLDLTAS